MQVSGAFCAGQLFSWLLGKRQMVGPVENYNIHYAGGVELIYTFMLCFVYLNCSTTMRSRGNKFYGLATGMTYLAGGYAAGGVSGGVFNPALVFGLDGITLDWMPWAYAAYEMSGGVFAAMNFCIIHPEEFDDPGLRQLDARVEPGPLQKGLAEFIGTFLFVFTFGLNLSSGSSATPYSAGSCFLSMTYALADVSGAYFNPAFVLATLLSGRGRLRFSDSMICWLAQGMAGSMAGLLYGAYHVAGGSMQGRPISVGPGLEHGFHKYSLPVALTMECMFTGLIALVYLSVVDTNNDTRFYFGLVVGFAIVAAGFACGHISGGNLNPALVLGICTGQLGHQADYVFQAVPWANSLWYSSMEMTGAAISTAVFYFIYRDDYRKGRYVEVNPLPPLDEKSRGYCY